MRIIFMGSPEFAVPALDALVEAGHEIVGGLLPAAAAGRAWQGGPEDGVHERAEQLGLEVRTPEDASQRGGAGEIRGAGAPIWRSSRPTG